MFSKINYLVLTILVIILVACTEVLPNEKAKKESSVIKNRVELSIEGRDVNVWTWRPSSSPKGHILFSHGAASAPLKYEAIIKPWVDSGYAVYAPLHVDSTDHPDVEKYQGFASWTARLEDAALVADYMNTDRYIAAGHSYGALVALTLGGAQPMVPEEITKGPKDERASLVLAFSPPGAIPNFVSKESYSALSVPALIQTGTLDVPMGGSTDYTVHLDAYHAAPERGTVYGLVLDGVDHYFGGAICRPELEGPQQIEQLQMAIDISKHMIGAYFEKNEVDLAELSRQLSVQSTSQFMRK